DLLCYGSRRLCADPRDKVYGLLGIAPPEVATLINPDYTSPISEVYQTTFQITVDAVKRLDLLGYCEHSHQRRLLGLPSWIPNWSVPIGTVPSLSSAFAAGNSKAAVRFLGRSRSMEVTGVRIGVVREVKTDSAEHLKDPQRFADRVVAWAPDSVTLDTELYPTGESLLDAYTLTLCQNRVQTRPSSGESPRLPMWKMAVWNLLSDPTNPSYRSEVASSVEVGRGVGLAFVITEDVHFGLGSPSTKPSDIICVLLGCKAPIVIRPRTDGGFEVVGACYLHGFSDAESLLGPLPAPWETAFHNNISGNWVLRFRNNATGEKLLDDPRKGSLPEGWSAVNGVADLAERQQVPFQNDLTGEASDCDPRMTVEALKQCGVNLETFCLF
ncbi:hypothetical protein QBC35DRAFT_391426, partial [Podospora australis]